MKAIPLSHGKVALVDDEDYPKVAGYRWRSHEYPGGRLYAETGRLGGLIRMHRLIAGAQDGFPVDHINGNGLDNRRCNLRICLHAENCRNTRKRAKARTPYKGVSIESRAKSYTFRARIRFQGKLFSLGAFRNAISAAYAYDRAARQYFGVFARCNFPPPPMLLTDLPAYMREAA